MTVDTLLTASTKRRNDYSEENLFHCSYGDLTVVLRHTWKIVDPSFNPRVEPMSWCSHWNSSKIYWNNSLWYASCSVRHGFELNATVSKVLDTLKSWPDDGAGWKVKVSSKLLQFILRGTWMSVQRFMEIHVVVKIFHLKSQNSMAIVEISDVVGRSTDKMTLPHHKHG